MNWKEYKALSLEEKRNDIYYIIGLDLGNDSSGMAFYNLSTNSPEAIDLSGGYGKPSMPTVIQYIAETKEWVFGEYAVLNRGAGTEITLRALIERLGNFEYIDVDRRSLSVANVLSLFIKELLGNVRNINPKAEIAGIVATVPAYFCEQACDELKRAFKFAGYEDKLVALVSDRECVLAHHYHSSPVLELKSRLDVLPLQKEERVMLFDYGARELRGGLYNVKSVDGGILATSVSSLFRDDIGVAKINKDIDGFFEAFVRKEVSKDKTLTVGFMRQLLEHISAFSYQHRDILFQRNIRTKPVKVYFNFTYPPFQQTITNEQIQSLVRPYSKGFDNFIQDVFAKNISGTPVTPKDIDTVLCVGGGFEMLWAKEAVNAVFTNAQVSFYKNPKMINCEGAAIVAACALGIPGVGAKLELEDTHQLAYDIGLSDGKNFLPLVERNAFWWQSHQSKLILVNQEINGELDLGLCRRTGAGELQNIGSMRLRGLPPRPKGTTRLEVGLNFVSDTEAVVTVRDRGFGEMFPQTGFEKDVQVKLG